MRSRTPLPTRQPGQLLPFTEAAALFAALCIFARSAVLVLAALLAAPIPAVQTVIALGQQAAQAQQAASVQADPAPESAPEAAASSVPQAVQALTGSIEDYLVPLLGEDARRTQAVFLKRIIRRAAAISTSPAGREASKTTPGRRPRTLPRKLQIRCPLPSSRTARTRRCL